MRALIVALAAALPSLACAHHVGGDAQRPVFLEVLVAGLMAASACTCIVQ